MIILSSLFREHVRFVSVFLPMHLCSPWSPLQTMKMTRTLLSAPLDGNETSVPLNTVDIMLHTKIKTSQSREGLQTVDGRKQEPSFHFPIYNFGSIPVQMYDFEAGN